MKIIDGPYTGTLFGLGFELYQVYFNVHQKVLELHSIDPLSPWLRFVRNPNDEEFFICFGSPNQEKANPITLVDTIVAFTNYLRALEQECQRLRATGASP